MSISLFNTRTPQSLFTAASAMNILVKDEEPENTAPILPN